MRLIASTAGLMLSLLAATTAPAQSVPTTSEQCLGGRLDAPIRVNVFSDFQCPSCAVFFADTIRQVLRDYSSANKVCVAYHEFPLPGHSHAREAARWSVAAQKLGKRQWLAVMEALYSQQALWSQSGKVESTVAGALSSDDYMAAKKLLLTPEIDQAVNRDVALGKQFKIESTPTMFVYAIGREQKVVGGLPYAALKDFFDRIVK
jgi:protein-disulfide isomerase